MSHVPFHPVRVAYLLYRMRRRRKRGRSVRLRIADVGRFLRDLETARVPHVVMRWFDEVPLTPAETAAFRGDVDLLVGDEHETAIARAAARNRGPVAVELRSVHGRLGSFAGMPYYPPVLAAEMLAGRVRHPRGFFVPGPGQHLPSLLFHLCYHKGQASGLPPGVPGVPVRAGKRDYAAKLRAVARQVGAALPEPLTLVALHEELGRVGWAMPLDLLTRWPGRSAWFDLLIARERARVAAAARAQPDLAVFILREDLGDEHHQQVLAALGRVVTVVEYGRLSAEQRQRVQRHTRGGSWIVREGASPSGPSHYVLCLNPPCGGTSRPHIALKRALRKRLRRDLAGCRHGLHASDDAEEGHHMLEVLFGADAARKRAELAGARVGVHDPFIGPGTIGRDQPTHGADVRPAPRRGLGEGGSIMRAGKWVLAVLGAVALVIGGVVHADEGRDDDDREESGRILRVFEALGAQLTRPEKAVAAALAVRPGKAVALELGAEPAASGPKVVWEVEIVADGKLHEVRVDALDGSVLGQEEDPEDAAEAAAFEKLLAQPGLTLEAVLAKSRGTVSGIVTEVELERERGALVWELELVSRGALGEVALGYASGLVVPDGDDDDDDDDDDD